MVGGTFGGRAAGAMLLAAGAGLLALAWLPTIDALVAQAAYTRLATQVREPKTSAEPEAGRNPLETVPEAAAWVSVDGTGIDLPVAQAEEASPHFYLDHDLWGAESSAGCPFIDERTHADARHALVFGHRLGVAGGMFSPLATCHEQEEFDSLGTLSWWTKRGLSTFEPLCALSVDESSQQAQRFSFASDEGFRDWLRRLAADATAFAPDRDTLTEGATRAITLVTCTKRAPGQRDRTLVVFVSSDERAVTERGA